MPYQAESQMKDTNCNLKQCRDVLASIARDCLKEDVTLVSKDAS